MTEYVWDTKEYREGNYRRTVANAATEVRVHNILGNSTAEHNEALSQRVLAVADKADVNHRTAVREWVAQINTPHADDQEIADLKTKWDAIQHEPETIGWYNRWFCENTMDHGAEYTLRFYGNCLSQYEEWMSDKWASDEVMLETLKENYAEVMRERCKECSVYTEAARLAGTRMFWDDIPDTEHAKHVTAGEGVAEDDTDSCDDCWTGPKRPGQEFCDKHAEWEVMGCDKCLAYYEATRTPGVDLTMLDGDHANH